MGGQDRASCRSRSGRRTTAARAGADHYRDDDKGKDPDQVQQTPLPPPPRGQWPLPPRWSGRRSVHRL